MDAPHTAYALVAKKILKINGLVEGRDYKQQGLKSMGQARTFIDRQAAREHGTGIAKPAFMIAGS